MQAQRNVPPDYPLNSSAAGATHCAAARRTRRTSALAAARYEHSYNVKFIWTAVRVR